MKGNVKQKRITLTAFKGFRKLIKILEVNRKMCESNKISMKKGFMHKQNSNLEEGCIKRRVNILKALNDYHNKMAIIVEGGNQYTNDGEYEHFHKGEVLMALKVMKVKCHLKIVRNNCISITYKNM